MASYLDGGSYLGQLDDFDARGATADLSPALGDSAGMPAEVVILPGGIVIPKKTLYLLIAALAVTALVIYLRKDRRKLETSAS